MNKLFLSLVILGATQLTGCAGMIAFTAIAAPTAADRASKSSAEAPVLFTEPSVKFDDNTKYNLTGRALTVRYDRYQFFPSANEMDDECRAKMAEVSKKIAFPYDSASFRIKHGRNLLLGISNCEMSLFKMKD